MANSNPKCVTGNADAAACEEAWRALTSYDLGSARASLLPIDDAVAASLPEPAARARIEARLLNALKTTGSAVAKEFISSKLAIIGTRAAVRALAALLGEPGLATAARNALERIPGAAPSAALRKALPKSEGSARLGIIQSLAVRRDGASVGLLAALLRTPDPQLAGAAAAALGEIGTARAGRKLRDFFGQASDSLRREVADAMLVCAERLDQSGRRAEAEALLRPLVGSGLPEHITRAAEQGLRHPVRTS
jgi:HEAT repeat protein